MNKFSIKHCFITKKKLFIGVLVSTICLSVVYSCGTHSVRYIKDNQIAEAESMRPIRVGYRTPKVPITSDLFLQSRRLSIEFPADNFDDKVTTGEKPVDTRTLDTLIYSIDGTDSVNVSYTVKIPITRFSRTVSEHNGKIDADFIIKVPKEFLSDLWCVTLTPEVKYNDSVHQMTELVIKGAEFYNKQLDDYKAYDDFLLSIVDKSQYDSLFIDRRGIMQDMRKRQGAYWEIYNKDWTLQMEYESWKTNNETEKMKLEADKIGREKSLLQEYNRNAMNQAAMDLAAGKDTVGIYEKYMKQYKKEVAKLPGFYKKREESLDKIPKKFKNIHEAKRGLDDLTNRAMTEVDSLQIAKHRYQFDAIAENELKKKNKDEKFKEIVQFPFREDVVMDSIVDPTTDFVYRYKNSIPVDTNTKYVDLTIKGKVNAVDLSTFAFYPTDTLSYNIISLAGLADSSLSIREVVTKRNETREIAAYIDYPTNSWTVDPKYGNNRKEIAKITDLFKSLSNDNVFELDSVVLTTSSSLDGSFEGNAKISRWRAKSIKEYLTMILPASANVEQIFISKFIGEDWNTLLKLVDGRKDLLYKRVIMEMLTSPGVNPDETEKQIKRQFPSDYDIIHTSLYPLLRKTEAIFYIHRRGFTEDLVEQLPIEGYDEGLTLIAERKYAEALKILEPYEDYNTALCYACLEEYDKAYQLLSELPSTVKTEFLMANISFSMGNEAKTVQHLAKALRLDPNLKDKVELDHGLEKLIEHYGLN